MKLIKTFIYQHENLNGFYIGLLTTEDEDSKKTFLKYYAGGAAGELEEVDDVEYWNHGPQAIKDIYQQAETWIKNDKNEFILWSY